MDLKSLAATVSKFAPALGAALLGPPGAALGVGIASLFGVSADDPNLANLIATNPDAAVKLKEFETQVLLAQINQENNDVNAEIADRNSARVNNKDPVDEGIKVLIILFIMSVVFYCLHAVAVGDVQGSEKDIIMMVLGGFVTKAGTIVDFFFGTSFSSREKDQMIYGKK